MTVVRCRLWTTPWTIAGPGDSYSQERVVYKDLQIAGHPDILLNRMAKTGLDHFRKRF